MQLRIVAYKTDTRGKHTQEELQREHKFARICDYIHRANRFANFQANETERNANTRGDAVDAILHLAETKTQNASSHGHAA
jgi:hypothetical protein